MSTRDKNARPKATRSTLADPEVLQHRSPKQITRLRMRALHLATIRQEGQ